MAFWKWMLECFAYNVCWYCDIIHARQLLGRLCCLKIQLFVADFGCSVYICRYWNIYYWPLWYFTCVHIYQWNIFNAQNVNALIHQGWMTLVNSAIIGSDNGLWQVWHQPIIWTNDELLLIALFGTTLSKVWIERQHLLYMKIHLKVSCANS